MITDGRGQVDIDSQNEVQIDLLEWKEIWKMEAVNYLLNLHSPTRLQTLEELRNSQMLRTLIVVDGPYRRTRTRARRNILSNDEGGPSGTACIIDVDET